MTRPAPTHSGATLDAVTLAEERYADWPPGLRTNMVMSLDGAVSFRGRVGPLSSPVDRLLFRALRALSEVILVGAATARAEKYGPVTFGERLVELRRRAGLPSTPPRIAVVTASGVLPDRLRTLPEGQRPIVITAARAVTEEVRTHADVIVAGEAQVDLPRAIGALRDRHVPSGPGRILCEGGPILLDGLTAADLVDELCVTLTPQLTAEAVPAATVMSPLDQPRRFRLDHAIPHGDELFLRYIR